MKNNELLEALTILEREKNISKSTLLEAIESPSDCLQEPFPGKAGQCYRFHRPGDLRVPCAGGQDGSGGSHVSRGADFTGRGKDIDGHCEDRRCGSD